MAIRTHGSTTTGITADASGDTWITREGQYVADDVDAVNFLDFDNCEYFLNGDVYAGDDGIVASSGCNNLDISVSAGASILAGGDGIQLFGNTSADSGHNITNDGVIVGQGGEGVDVRATFSTLVNNGTINGQGFGVFFSGTGHEIVNNGAVTSNSTAIGISGDNGLIVNTGTAIATGGNGLDINGANGEIHNHGLVQATIYGIDMSGKGGSILNAGSVDAQTGIRVTASTDTLADSFVVNNSGSVEGLTAGIQFIASESVDSFRLVNSGTIRVGNAGADAVSGSDSADVIRNTGTIDGNISLAGGDDVYRGAQGQALGKVEGGDGADTIVGGTGDDEISGGNQSDLLSGRNDDDNLVGGGGGDIIRGGSGDDTLRGGNGADTLLGGRDDDQMFGGGGQDVFVFAPPAGYDVVSDFKDGADRFDVSAFDVQNFGALSAGITTSRGDAFIDWSVFGGSGILQIEDAAGLLDGSDFLF